MHKTSSEIVKAVGEERVTETLKSQKVVNVGMIEQDWADVNTEKTGSSKVTAWTLITKKTEKILSV